MTLIKSYKKLKSPQKQLPENIARAHFMITKRDFISRGSCFCEKYISEVNIN